MLFMWASYSSSVAGAVKDTGREVSFVIIAHSDAKDEIRMALDDLKIEYPVYCDPDDGYIKDNNLSVKAI